MSDVTIKGAGIIGLSIAFKLLTRGARVTVIDPNGPGGGASGSLVGAMAPHVPENWNAKKAFQLDSLLNAEAFWQDVEEISGLSSGYARTGRVQPIEDDAARDLAVARANGARSLWQGRASWRVADVDEFEFTPNSPTGLVIHDTLTARLHPHRACQTLSKAVTKMGGAIVADADTKGIVIEASGVAGLDSLSKMLGAQVGTGVKGQAALLDYDARNSPQIFADTLHIIPHEDGTTAVGSTSERDYAAPDDTDAQLDTLIDRARKSVPALASASVLARWAGVRPRARSRAPMLGPCPVRPSYFIANGGFKIGFGMAPKIAEVMTDLVLENKDEIPLDFRVEASLPIAAK